MRLDVNKSHAPALDLLPLLNVVFLLLIFFLVMVQFGGEGRDTRIPASRSAVPADASSRSELSLAADGLLRLDGQVVEDQDLGAALLQPRPTRVVLRADAEVHAVRALAVVGLLNAAGVGEVELLTRVP